MSCDCFTAVPSKNTNPPKLFFRIYSATWNCFWMFSSPLASIQISWAIRSSGVNELKTESTQGWLRYLSRLICDFKFMGRNTVRKNSNPISLIFCIRHVLISAFIWHSKYCKILFQRCNFFNYLTFFNSFPIFHKFRLMLRSPFNYES